MKERTRLGLAALGAYLASVGTMLALGVGRGLPAWLSGELAWDLSMSAVVGMTAAVVGVCFVLAAATQASRSAAHEHERTGSPAMRPAPIEELHARSEVAAAGHGPGAATAEAGSGAGVSAAGQTSEGLGRVESAGRAGVGRNSGSLRAPAILGPDALIRCWRRYRDEGDGHFRADGLRAELTESGFAMEVIEGRDLGAGDDVLVVPTGAPDDACYLVPSFAKSPDAVGRWFEDRGDRSLSRRVNDIAELAEGGRTADGVVLVRKGAVS